MCISDTKALPQDYLENTIHDFTSIGLENSNDNCDYIPIDEISDIRCNKANFKAVQLNIRGLISKCASLSTLLSQCLLTKKMDIVMLCETWLTSSVKSLLNVPGYQYHGLECTSRKGGGVGLLIANAIKFKPKHDLDIINADIECCFVELFTKSGNMICGSLYRPPNTNVKNFQKLLNGRMGKIKSDRYKNVVIGMDQNLDFLKMASHKGTKTFITSLLNNLLFPCITRPTRVTNSTANFN